MSVLWSPTRVMKMLLAATQMVLIAALADQDSLEMVPFVKVYNKKYYEILVIQFSLHKLIKT